MMSVEQLVQARRSDGSWGYGFGAGGGWTEPTCYALLALSAAGTNSLGSLSTSWLKRLQGADGGFSPRESVPESTWVTALVLLLPAELTPGVDRRRALDWILAQTGRESGWVYWLRNTLISGRSEPTQQFDGWPWYPGAAAWVLPTALSLLALNKASALDSRIAQRITEGRSFLLSRRCVDGGWNHGSTRALGYDSSSYPETTGVALLSLSGQKGPEIERGLAIAEQHLARCESSEAASWLALGLRAHGRATPPPAIEARGGIIEAALSILTDAAARGQNAFLN